MLAGFGRWLEGVFAKVLPDPFVIAVGLTVLTAGVAFAFGTFTGPGGEALSGGSRAVVLLDAWRGTDGLWKFLGFAMQMCLVLVTGYALAESPPVRRVVTALAALPRTGPQAGALVALIACLAGLVNWGLGLIVGALLARDVARTLRARGVRVHPPVLAAAGYTGLLVWHGGLSGTAPLKSVTPEEAATVLPSESVALVGDGIPLDQTLLSPFNLIVTGGMVVVAVGVLWMLSPRGEHASALAEPRDSGSVDPPAPEAESARDTLPAWLEHTRWVSLLLGAAFLLGAGRGAIAGGVSRLGLNEINAAMLGFGLVLHPSIGAYTRAATEAARSCVGIILQFPLYAGIMGMLSAGGLVTSFSRALVGAGGPEATPVLTFLSAAVVNVFVPSGGGQWGIQGPIALDAAQTAGVDPGVMVLAVAYGDQLTNMLQPFWALPLLAITGVRARELVGYSAVVMLAAGLWCAACLLVLPGLL